MDVWGKMTLHVIKDRCEVNDTAVCLRAICHEDNNKGELVDWFQETRQEDSGILCDAGAYTHTSVAILDAIGASDLPMIEVHLSNIQKAGRHKTFVKRLKRCKRYDLWLWRPEL